MNKIALVTGANKGTGYEVARQLCDDDDGPTGAFFDENGPMPW